MVKGYQVFSEVLPACSSSTVFSMVGGSNVAWISYGVEQGRLRLVRARHEETAISAAVGFGRATGTIGLCSVTRGPGFANAINPLIAAARTHMPIILVVGQSPTTDAMSAQNVPQQEFTTLIGAGFHHAASASELAMRIHEATNAARWNGRPQVLSVGDDVMDGEVEESALQGGLLSADNQPDPASISTAVDVLEGASCPLIIAGNGAVLADSHLELVELARLTGARLSTSLMANRFFDGHPHDMGLSGGWASPASHAALRKSDVVISFGASMNIHTMDQGRLYSAASFLQCDVDPSRIGLWQQPDHALVGDARATAKALIAEWIRRGLGARSVDGDTPDIEAQRESMSIIDLGKGREPDGLDPRVVYAAVNRKMPPDRIVVSDSGRSLAPMASLIDAQDARSFLIGRGYGSIGLGLGTAIGAAVAHPDRRVVLFAGDGGFMMSLAGLDTVRLNDIKNLTVVVMNDEQYGAERKHLAKYELPYGAIQQPMPDIEKMAELFGGAGTVVGTQADLDNLQLDLDQFHLIDARISRNINPHGAVGGR